MTLFVDASALVAILLDEPNHELFARAIQDDDDPLWSAMSCWESVVAFCRRAPMPFWQAKAEVEKIAAARPFRLVPINEDERSLAIEAYAAYGKGRHRAGLNMGDCFAYACAKANGAKLLYKGDDFVHTDLA